MGNQLENSNFSLVSLGATNAYINRPFISHFGILPFPKPANTGCFAYENIYRNEKSCGKEPLEHVQSLDS